MAMTAHVVMEALDPDRPSTQSPLVIDFLRQRVGLEMLLMTDDISMGALQGDVGERSEAAIAAGCDLVLHCNGVLEEMKAVAEITPTLSGRSLERAEAALKARKAPDPIDIPAAVLELGDLLRESTYA